MGSRVCEDEERGVEKGLVSGKRRGTKRSL